MAMLMNIFNRIINYFKVQRIKHLCKKYAIEEYSINADYSIDVEGDVSLASKRFVELPLRFRRVSDSFFCGNNHLKTLKGSPEYVGGIFFCGRNKLANLKYFPKVIGVNYMFLQNPLPNEINLSMIYENGLYKYQDEYAIWNDDGSFNKGRWNILMNDYKRCKLV